MVPCYGVIITARCDIAQHKVPKYYFLTAIEASEWFCSEQGYQQAYSETIKQKMKNVYDKAEELELDAKTLLAVSEDSLQVILEDKRKQLEYARIKKADKKIKDLIAAIKEYVQVAQIGSASEQKRHAIQANDKPAIKCLKDIDAGKLHHYYFLPQAAYLDNNVKSKGLIIDLLEIGSLEISDANKITNPFLSGIHYAGLPTLPTKEELANIKTSDKAFARLSEYIRLKQAFWLEKDSDFVGVEGTIRSPWCEHLMQRFSNVFVRIGLENPTDDDFRAVIKDCYREGLS